MRLSKNKLLLVVFLIANFLLTGCSLTSKEFDSNFVIEDKEIFNQKDSEYYVYFYKEDCKYCKDAYSTVNKYLESDKTIKLFVCNLTDSSIKKIYEGENGQGTDGAFFVNNVLNYEDLYIAAVPSLIKVKNGISEFIASGRKNVISFIENLNASQPNHIHKYSDGICSCGDKQIFTVFFKDCDGTILKEEKVLYGKDANPPQISYKEGYLFTGWDNDLYYITKNISITAQYNLIYEKEENGIPILTEDGDLYIRNLYHQAYDPSSNLEDIIITRYCGNYNGAEVVKESKGGADILISDKVADFSFRGAHAADYYEVIYNNKLYRLNEAYENNILTYEDIKEIYRLNALWRAYENDVLSDEYRHKMVLTIYGEQRLLQRFYDNYYKDNVISDINDLLIKTYVCGKWNKNLDIYYDFAIVDYKGSNYVKGEYKEVLGGYEFIYPDNNTIKVISSNNEVYTLKEAYNMNYLSFDDIEYIQHFYESQYTVDYILNEQELGLQAYPKRVDNIKQRYLEKFYPDSEYTIDDLEIVEMYCVSSYGIYVAKIINKKDIKEEKLYTVNVAGYNIINDENNPIFYFHLPNNQSIYNRVIKVEDAYKEGFIERSVLEIIEFTQENIYYKK